MKLLHLSLPALLLTTPLVCASEDLTVLPKDAKSPPSAQLRTYLLAECQKHFDARRGDVAKLKTPADVQARQKALRDKFLESLGGFPERTPLNARVVGTLKGDGYTVEKVIYESRPGHHVTANFYLPQGKGPFPGVLMPIGHSANGKAADYVQRGCILLAKNGMAALAYDPIGQGERRQLLGDAGKPAISSSTNEHSLLGVGALLVGSNTATYRIWDGIRSLDYLASRPEVDATKLGCTGCSGGGTLTSYLMSLDDRIAVAAPSCYITSLERLFATIGPQDAEQNVTGQVAFGLEHADYLGLRAPKPTLICAATSDFFDIQGTWTSFREAKRLYTLLGHPERVDLLESNTNHGYPRAHREGMARWMKRWLAGKDEAIVEGDWPIAKDDELRCTRTGQVLEDLKGVSAFGLNVQRARLLKERKEVFDPQADLSKLLGVALPVGVAKRTEVGRFESTAGQGRKLIFETEPGVLVPALLFETGKDATGLTVVVHDGGKSAAVADGLIAKRVGAGQRVLALDLRGWGETASAAMPKKVGHFGIDFKEAYLGLHLNRPLTGQRVHDLLAVLEQVGEKVEAVGGGKGGVVVLHAAALSPRITRVRLERALVSWSNVVETPLSYDQLTQAVPRALTRYDLPELAGTLAPRRLVIASPVNAAGTPLTAEAAQKAYQETKASYERKKAASALELLSATTGDAREK